jgi:hypothetical protein
MLNKFLRLFFPMFFCEPERARDDKGRLRADDKSTPTVNEAWVGGKAPVKKKRGRPAKIAAPKKRGRPPKAKK